MIKLLFIRHGATEGNLEKRYIGSTDEALCKKGIEQIEALKIHDFQVDHVFVSPMRRTRQTAEILFPKSPCTIVDDLAETNFGRFEGKTAEELSGTLEYQKWLDSMCLDPIPGGEGVTDFKRRSCEAFARVINGLPDRSCAAFVVHGGVIMAVLETFAWPRKEFYDYHIANGAYIAAYYEDGNLRIIDG